MPATGRAGGALPGGAGCRAEDTVELLIERAEESLQESVGKGGNCVVVLS